MPGCAQVEGDGHVSVIAHLTCPDVPGQVTGQEHSIRTDGAASKLQVVCIWVFHAHLPTQDGALEYSRLGNRGRATTPEKVVLCRPLSAIPISYSLWS
jgi:hypothetical protein